MFHSIDITGTDKEGEEFDAYFVLEGSVTAGHLFKRIVDAGLRAEGCANISCEYDTKISMPDG